MSELAEYGQLWPAERKYVNWIRAGNWEACPISLDLPPIDAPIQYRLRASFLRQVALGGWSDCPIPHKGLRISGAYIEGDGRRPAETRGIDLEGCRLEHDIALLSCRIPDCLIIRGARVRSIFLSRSLLRQGLSGDRASIDGSIIFRNGHSFDEIRLGGAKVSGDIDLSQSHLNSGPSGIAIFASDTETHGVFMLRKVRSLGEIIISRSRIGGDLDCGLAEFTAIRPGHALNSLGVQTKGSVILSKGVFYGEVGLQSARIGGKLACNESRFSENGSGRALGMDGAVVDGTWFFREGTKVIEGVLDLTGAKLGHITDEKESWPRHGQLLLDRCTYGGFVAAPIDSASRIDWLSRQDPSKFGHDFWPQPWEECARALREGGHIASAREVLVEKEKRQRVAILNAVYRDLFAARSDRDAAQPLAGFRIGTDRVIALWWKYQMTRLWHGLLGSVVGYGRRPQNAAFWACGFLVIGWLLFGIAAGQGAIKPNLPQIQRAEEWVNCAADGERRDGYRSQLECYLAQPEAISYPRFNAFIYSADTLLPVVSFEMQSYWIPDDSTARGYWTRVYLWLHITAGWALTLLAVAGFSGIIKQDGK